MLRWHVHLLLWYFSLSFLYFCQAVGWVVGFVMGDFTYTLMGWAAGMVLSMIVSSTTNCGVAVSEPLV